MSHPIAASSTARKRLRGFTLIELMITIAIVAILSAVAVPAYSDYIRRGQLPEAFTNLADYQVKMEQYYQDNRNYGTAACADVGPPSWSAWPSNRKYFAFDCRLSAGGQGYDITATGSSARAVGHDYAVNQDNTQTTSNFKGAAVVKTCWVARGDEC